MFGLGRMLFNPRVKKSRVGRSRIVCMDCEKFRSDSSLSEAATRRSEIETPGVVPDR